MYNKLQMLRTQANLTQKQLSDISGVPRATISHIEQQDYTPNVIIAIKLANALKCDVTDIFILKS